MASAVKSKRESSGATAAKRGLGAGLTSYFTHHRSSFRSTVKRLFSDRGQTIMTSLVVAIALALPALLMVTLTNLQQLGDAWDTEPKLSLYLNDRARQEAIDAFISELEKDLRVASLRYVSAEDALVEFEANSGFGAILDGLDSNPLPGAIVLSLAQSFQTTAQQKQLAAEWQAHALVDQAMVDLQWVQRFLAMTELARKIVLFLALLLAIGALLAIGNTIRLIIENRKDEIIVIKLVGGTNGFVRRPLLYTGGAYGFVGSVIALVLVQTVLWLISPGVKQLAFSYQSDFALQGLGIVSALKLLVAGIAIGWLGAVFAVGRHLNEIEPK